MLLGSAPLGALALGDAPPVIAFLVPIVLRRPSGHNIGASPGPVFPSVFIGSLPDVPAQRNEPGVTLYFSAGVGDLPTTSLVFTKPSGSAYEVGPPLIYIGKPIATLPEGNFQGGTYIVYTFGQNELDELGTWEVQASNGFGGTGAGTFIVGTPSPVAPLGPLPQRSGPAPPGPTPVPGTGGAEQFVYLNFPIVSYALPAAPTLNQKITVIDSSGTATSSPITVSGNGHLINGLSIFIINQNHASYGFVWNGTQWNIV